MYGLFRCVNVCFVLMSSYNSSGSWCYKSNIEMAVVFMVVYWSTLILILNIACPRGALNISWKTNENFVRLRKIIEGLNEDFLRSLTFNPNYLK